jgi:HlyD family secretion protein
MSATMIMGRVVLPVSAVLLLIVLAWHTVQTMAVRAGSSVAGRVDSPGARSTPAGRVTAEGRVAAYPGAEVTVGTEVLGTILEMPAREKATVRRGELLVQLRDDDLRASLGEARSRLTEVELALRLERARFGMDRVLPGLVGQPSPSPNTRRDELTAAEAHRAAARAAVARRGSGAAHDRILAPIDGVVIARHADPGETVAPAAPLVTIADLARLRIEAEVDEFDIPHIAPDAEATITAEGYPGPGWRGRVEEIADTVGPRRTRPEDPARSPDTRVLLVRIAFLQKTPLKLGQRVEVEITQAHSH